MWLRRFSFPFLLNIHDSLPLSINWCRAVWLLLFGPCVTDVFSVFTRLQKWNTFCFWSLHSKVFHCLNKKLLNVGKARPGSWLVDKMIGRMTSKVTSVRSSVFRRGSCPTINWVCSGLGLCFDPEQCDALGGFYLSINLLQNKCGSNEIIIMAHISCAVSYVL